MNYLIFAAGIGSRLDGSKYFLKINGYTLIEHVYHKIIDKSNIFIVYRDENVRKNHFHLNVTWIKNDNPNLKKAISTHIGLSFVADKCILLLADMICISSEYLMQLSLRNKSTFSHNGKAKLPPLYLSKKDVTTFLSKDNNDLKKIVNDYILEDKDNLIDIDTHEDVFKVRKNILIENNHLFDDLVVILFENGFNVFILTSSNKKIVNDYKNIDCYVINNNNDFLNRPKNDCLMQVDISNLIELNISFDVSIKTFEFEYLTSNNIIVNDENKKIEVKNNKNEVIKEILLSSRNNKKMFLDNEKILKICREI